MRYYEHILLLGLFYFSHFSEFKVVGNLPTQNQERVQIWIKAFIPKSHPTNPNYVKPVPNRAGQFMIPPPVPIAIPGLGEPNVCYLTDARAFSTNPQAPARLTTEFEILINGSSATIAKVNGRNIHRADETEKVFCSTGASVARGTASVIVPGTGEAFGIGGPHIAGNQIQVIFQGAAKNPIVPVIAGIATPTIDYDVDIIYDKAAKKITFRATHGIFPAFEAYASRNGGPTKTLFRVMPEGATTWRLFDGGLGVASRVEQGVITF